MMTTKLFAAVSFMLLISVTVAQESEAADDISTKNNSSINGTSLQSSSMGFKLKDLVRVSQSESTNNTHQKRQTEYEQFHDLQPYDTFQHHHSSPGSYPNGKCACQTLHQQRDPGFRPMPQCNDPTYKSPNCMRRFLVKQLRETNENINRLLDCISRNNVVTNCPLPPRINLNFNEDEDCRDCMQSREHEDTKVSYPNPCEACMYKPDFPSEHAATKTYSKRMAPHEKPLIYRKIHTKPESEELDTNRFSGAKRFPSSDSCEEDSEESEEHTTKAHRRKCERPTPSAPSSTPIKVKRSKKECRKSGDTC